MKSHLAALASSAKNAGCDAQAFRRSVHERPGEIVERIGGVARFEERAEP